MTTHPFPSMRLLRQKLPVSAPLDIRATLQEEFPPIARQINPGARVAVGVGSRGITNLQTIVAGVLDLLKARGAQPFIVPAMGSHGGATPEGQRELLAEYGITEERLQVPIRPSMEAERIGVTPDGVEVFFSSEALRADGVVVVNRVKPHTDFQSDNLGSGLLKMLVVGLGKRVGAANYHTWASRFGYEEIIRASARITLQAAPILGGVAVVEDQVHATARLAVVLPADMESREKQLYREAKGLMPRLPFDDIDLLIVDRIGKNISGAGMDPNVIGRSLHGYCALLSDRSTKPAIRRIFVRDLTPETHGNGVGVGLADFTTSRLVRAIDQRVTFLNALTALSLQSVKVPIHFETDREAITRALESLALPDSTRARVVRIQDTLSVEKMEVSEALIEEARTRADLELLTTSGEMSFDPADNLAPMK